VSATDIVKQAQGEDVPYAKLSSEKQLGDPKLKLREEDVQAVVAALNFILTSAARCASTQCHALASSAERPHSLSI
jgi:hypothetical protein